MKLFTRYPAVILFICFISLIGVIGYIAQRFGTVYQERVTIEAQRQRGEEARRLSINKITLRKQKEGGDECIEIGHNGAVLRRNCTTSEILERGYLGSDQINELFGNLTLEDFDQLQGSYAGLSGYQIIIETNQGTKTITLGDGGGEVPQALQDLLDDLLTTEETAFVPTPPPVVATPTPLPTTTPPAPTPTPPAGGPTPKPTATPLPPGVTPEPFSCDMLDPYSRPINVSNTVCLPE